MREIQGTIMYTIANIRPMGQNVGNHAIHFGLKQLIYQAFGRLVSVIDYPSGPLPGDSGVSGITAESVNEINRFVDGVIVGGGNLYENGSLIVDKTALSALKPPLMLFSNSWGRTYDRFDVLQQRSDSISAGDLGALVQRADISLSRDSATHNLISNMGLNDSLGLCPTIGLSGHLANLPPLPESEDVGALISIRTPQLMNVSARHQRQIPETIEKAIDLLRSKGYSRVRILCNDKRDLDFATLFKCQDSRGVDSVFTSDVYEYLSLIRNAEFLVSFRLHATLPAISFGTPVVNLSYDERASSLIRDLHVEASSINLVEERDNLPSLLEKRIGEGGFIAPDEIQQNWKAFHKDQLQHFRRFKTMVSEYVVREFDRTD